MPGAAPPFLSSLHMHGCMQRRGGARRVLELLALGLAERGVAVSASHEIDEPDDALVARFPQSRRVPPAEAASLVREAGNLHLHASADWPVLLESLAGARGRLVITLHDFSLITGGCAFPLSCRGYETGCTESCPLLFHHTAQRAERLRKSLTELSPLLISPSLYLARACRQVLPGLNCRVIPNGVPWPRRLASKAAARVKLGLDLRAPVAIFVAHGGIKAKLKGGDRFEAIFASLARRVPKLKGVILGGEGMRQDGALIHWPYLDAPLLSQVLRAADVLVYPTCADNHPLVVLEAMAAELPVASYDEGGIAEQVPGPELGRLVPAGDQEALVEAAAELLTNPQKAKDIGRTAFEYGRTRFSLTRFVDDHLAAYLAAR